MRISTNDFESLVELKVNSSIVLNTRNLSSAKSTISKVKKLTKGSYELKQHDDFKIEVFRLEDKPLEISWTKTMRSMIAGTCINHTFKNQAELKKVRATASNLKHDSVIIKIVSNKLSATITREI